MKVKEIMTTEPACCIAESSVEEAARLMVDFDCGEIPVMDSYATMMPVGVITDRDITCRTVAKGLNPLVMQVGECMTVPAITVMPEHSLEECMQLLEQNQIRRVPVVDNGGKCIGIVALADVALNRPRADAGEVLKEVSESTAAAKA